MQTWQTQGTHRFYREEDLVCFECHGIFELADAQQMYAATGAVVHQYGYVLLLSDASAATGVSAEARRYIGERARAGYDEGLTVIVGSSFPMRAMITLLRNASRLIGQPMAPMRFCASSAEGLAWLATQRPLLRAKASRPG